MLRKVKGGCPHHSSCGIVRRVGLAIISSNKGILGSTEWVLFLESTQVTNRARKSGSMTRWKASRADGARFSSRRARHSKVLRSCNGNGCRFGERLHVRRPHRTMTRGVVCRCLAASSAIRSPEERKRGEDSDHRRQRVGPHGLASSRPHHNRIRSVPSQGPVAGRAGAKAAVSRLAFCIDDRSEGAPSGQWRRHFGDGVNTTKGAPALLLSVHWENGGWPGGFRRASAAGLFRGQARG